MNDTLNIQVLDIQEMPALSYADPEGIAVIMPCTDREMGVKTAEILDRRAGLPCRIFVVVDSIRQGFIRTLNEAAATIQSKYVVYLAQDAYTSRCSLKCAHARMEE